MGPWDVMSSHFVRKDEPPPGLCSFTRIRLNWISEGQVALVKPGQTHAAFLAPLSRGGDALAVKIPLAWGRYYLVENRQPIGYDRVLPDRGLLVLKVDCHAQEGSGTVKVMDADPGGPHFSRATFRPDKKERMRFLDRENNLAVISLWYDEDRLGVLVTAQDKCDSALEAVSLLRRFRKAHPEPRGSAADRVLEAALSALKRAEFETCARILREDL